MTSVRDEVPSPLVTAIGSHEGERREGDQEHERNRHRDRNGHAGNSTDDDDGEGNHNCSIELECTRRRPGAAPGDKVWLPAEMPRQETVRTRRARLLGPDPTSIDRYSPNRQHLHDVRQVVPGAGFEPARTFVQRGLSPPCLPVPPPGRAPHVRHPGQAPAVQR
jgi:hypothetical protein